VNGTWEALSGKWRRETDVQLPCVGKARYSGNRDADKGTVMKKKIDRITQDQAVMGGKPCIREMRVTVGMILRELGAGRTIASVLKDYPYLEREDVLQALRYAARLADHDSEINSKIEEGYAATQRGELIGADEARSKLQGMKKEWLNSRKKSGSMLRAFEILADLPIDFLAKDRRKDKPQKRKGL